MYSIILIVAPNLSRCTDTWTSKDNEFNNNNHHHHQFYKNWHLDFPTRKYFQLRFYKSFPCLVNTLKNYILFAAFYCLSFTDYISELTSLQLMTLAPFSFYPFKKEPTGFLYGFIIDRAWLGD